MKRQQIRTKLAAVVAAFVLIITLSVGATLTVVNRQDGDATKIQLAAQQRLLAAEIKQAAVELVLALESESDSMALNRRLTTMTDMFDASLVLLHQGGTMETGGLPFELAPPSPSVAALLDSALKTWKPYRQSLGVLTAKEIDLMSENFYDASQAVIEDYPELIDALEPVGPLLHEEADAKIGVLRWMLFATLVLTMGVSVAAWLFVLHRIVRPIADLADTIRGSTIDTDLTRRAPVASEDEIGHLAADFNQMVGRFESMLVHVIESAKAVSGRSERLADIAAETREGMAQQNRQLESLASSMTEMASSAESIVANTEQASSKTSGTAAEAERSQQAVQESSLALREMLDTMSRSSVEMSRLKEDADGIGAILDVIRSITEQTNLLALNAAIEAARAGEQGRGFAVVADEVRSLAQRTHQSTGEIQSMIAQLQENTERAAGFMAEGQSRAENSNTQIQGLFTSLERMIASVESVRDLNAEIAAAALQQNAATEDTNRALNEISTAIGETSEKAERTAEIGANLDSLSFELMHVVDGFKVGSATD